MNDFNLQLSDMPLAQQMKENVDVVRVDPAKDYDASDPTTFDVIASNIEVLLLDLLTAENPFSTGELIGNPNFTCDLFVPNRDIIESDEVIDQEGVRYTVTAIFAPRNTNLMTLLLRKL